VVTPSEISVFIDPVTRHFLRNELFNPESPHNFDDSLGAYIQLKRTLESHGVEVNTADYLLEGSKRNKVNVYFSLGIVGNYRALAGRDDVILSSFFTMEAPIVQPSAYFALPDISRRFRRIYCYSTPQALARYGCADLSFTKFHIPYTYDSVVPHLWANEERSLLCMVNANRLCRRTWQELYTERLRAVAYFAQFDEIDLYGFDWDQPPYLVGETWIPGTLRRMYRAAQLRFPVLGRHRYSSAVKKTWRGETNKKYDMQSRYTFTICYENMMLDGWLNENIFDCLRVGTIPIFLGPPDILDYVPEECFIDKRQFETYADLRAYLHSLSRADIRRYKEHGREFLASDRFKPFTRGAFADLFIRALEEDTGVQLGAGGSVARAV
jgi:hypothetical protein